MSKQVLKETLPDLHKRLNQLKVKRSVEKTDKYDNEIKSLREKIDFIEWGIK